MLQVRDSEIFHQVPGFKSLDPFLTVSTQGPFFTAIEEDGGDKRLVQFELACGAGGFVSLDPV